MRLLPKRPTQKPVRVLSFAVAFIFTVTTLSLVPDFSIAPIGSIASVVRAQDASLDLSALDEEQPTDTAISTEAVDSNADASAGSSNDVSSTSAEPRRSQFMSLVLASGWIGLVLLLGSIFATSLIIRLCLLLRRSVMFPQSLERELSVELSKGSYQSAFSLASQSSSLLGRVVSVGLRETDRDWKAVEKALEDSCSQESAALYRKTEPLSTIGNVAPMLGLLGTVLGMVTTFGELAVADASGRNLANGIYFALVTTVDGLIVAIPVLIAHSLLNVRIATLLEETAKRIDQIFAPVKRRLESRMEPTVKPSLSGLREASSTFQPSTSSLPRKQVPGMRERVSTDPQTPGTQQPSSRPSLSLKNRSQENN